MAEKTRPCPQCGGKMSFRLGEYQCDACDYKELQSPREEGPAAGRGLAPRWQPPGGPSAQAPPPPSSFVGSPQPGAPPSMYGGGALWEEVQPDYSDSLKNEKHVYFAVSALLTLIYLVSNSIVGAMSGSPEGAGTSPALPGMTMTSMLGGSIFFYGVWLLLTWWVLYSKEVWAKYTCIGCVSFMLLTVVFGTMGMLSLLQISSTFSNTPQAGIIRGIFIFMMLVQLAWYGWFISILYRDAKQLS